MKEEIQNLIKKKSPLTKEEIKYVNSFARVDRADKNHGNYYFAIKAIYAHETPFLKEWIGWHKDIVGADHIYLYCNVQDKRADEIIGPFVDQGFVTHILFDHIKKDLQTRGARDRKPQHFSSAHCYHTFAHEFQWIMQIDMDEFLVPLRDITIQNFLKERQKIAQYYFKRYEFGANGHIQHRPQVVSSYTKRYKIASSVKAAAKSHWIRTKNEGKKARLDNFTDENFVASCHEWFIDPEGETKRADVHFAINHYTLKSLIDFLRRPMTITGFRQSTVRQWLDKNEHYNQVEDLRALNLLKNKDH